MIVTLDAISAHALDGHVLPVDLAVPAVDIPELSRTDLLVQDVDIHCLGHHLI